MTKLREMTILRGWKAICTNMGGMSEEVARKLMREKGLPVSIIGGKPMTTIDMLEMWIQFQCAAAVRQRSFQKNSQ